MLRYFNPSIIFTYRFIGGAVFGITLLRIYDWSEGDHRYALWGLIFYLFVGVWWANNHPNKINE